MPTYSPRLISTKKGSKKGSLSSMRPINPARKKFIIEGLEFHVKRAMSEKDQNSIKAYIVEATANLNKPTSFMWLKQYLSPNAKRLQQWQLYTYKTAPAWIIKEYESFWKIALGEYSKALGNINKSFVDVLGGILAPKRSILALNIKKGILVRKSMRSVDVGYAYAMTKDNKCGEDEFYLTHPESRKQYKVKAGKHDVAKNNNLEKSWFSELADKHPLARWVTIIDGKSPLNLKSILISPDISGEANILWLP